MSSTQGRVCTGMAADRWLVPLAAVAVAVLRSCEHAQGAPGCVWVDALTDVCAVVCGVWCVCIFGCVPTPTAWSSSHARAFFWHSLPGARQRLPEDSM